MTSTLRERRIGSGDSASTPTPSTTHLDLLDEFNTELERLSAMQRELLHELRSDGAIDLDTVESPSLRQENEELRARVEQLERQLHTGAPGEDMWLERQSEYEKLLEEKSEVIRALHLKMQEAHHAASASGGRAAPADDGPPQGWREEIAEQRAQLEQDEAAMMEQMRTMEMALARDRAELARMRTELQRQQTDFARDVEIASRDPQLRERLASLRRPQEASVKRSPEAPAAPHSSPPVPTPPKSSGFIRRIFG